MCLLRLLVSTAWRPFGMHLRLVFHRRPKPLFWGSAGNETETTIEINVKRLIVFEKNLMVSAETRTETLVSVNHYEPPDISKREDFDENDDAELELKLVCDVIASDM